MAMRSAYDVQRRLMVRLTALAVACAAAQAVTGVEHLTLWLTPLFLLAALLLSGRYVGEEQLLAARARRVAPTRPRRVAVAWPRLHELGLASLLERSTALLRGPSAAACS